MIGTSDNMRELPTEVVLADTWAVSRTTVRTILNRLQDAGIIEWSGRSKKVLRKPRQNEYFPVSETEPVSEKLPSMFMEYIFAKELTPGTTLRETELAKAFGVGSTAVREFLIRFSRFGLIKKNPNRHWVLLGFTQGFAEELFDVREVFERKAFNSFLNGSPARHMMAIELRAQHEEILTNIKRDYLLFPRLDEKFHRTWIDDYNNRFVRDFFELISLVFHYHYRWNKRDELQRNQHAIQQHLEIIAALESGDLSGAKSAFDIHLIHAEQTLLESAIWDNAPQ